MRSRKQADQFMPASNPKLDPRSAKALTLTAYATFLPIGIVTVLLGPMLPTLSARWSLNYAQQGALFNAQYFASTAAVAISGWLVSRWGYRFAMKSGLLFVTAGLALLLSGSEMLGIACIAMYGAGLGLAVPATNLLVAEVNPSQRSAKLNVVNFCWSVGAVACSFLVAAAAKAHRVPLLLGIVAGCMLLVFAGIAAMPASIVEPPVAGKKGPSIPWKHRSLVPLGAMFFIYVGTENGVGGWVASYAKSLGSMSATMSLVTPSFFYAALMLGRLLAPMLLRTLDEIRLVQAGLLAACAGTAGLLLSHRLPGVAVSAALTGLGRLSDHNFGSVARVWRRGFAGWIGHVYARQSRWGIDAVAGGSLVEQVQHAEGGPVCPSDGKCRDVRSLSSRVEACAATIHVGALLPKHSRRQPRQPN
jgi:FHS family glucose/mannose:H+ symporter-like MFS transporter